MKYWLANDKTSILGFSNKNTNTDLVTLMLPFSRIRIYLDVIKVFVFTVNYIVFLFSKEKQLTVYELNTVFSSNFQYNMFYKPNVFFLEFDKRMASKYHMQIFGEGNSTDVQYKDEKTTFSVAREIKDMYKPRKVPLPTRCIVPRLIKEELVTGELSILPIYV